MDLKQLLYFVTISDEGNISNAAKKLYLTQPPLSYQMKLLEDELNCTLFERGTRNIKLTDEGQLLYQRAKDILDLTSITKDELLSFSESDIGTIRIGMVSSVASSYGAKWIGEFSKKYPKIQFEIIEANTYILLNKLKENLIHLAIIRSPYSETKYERMVLAQEPLYAIGLPDIFREETECIDLKQLCQYPLITYRRWKKIVESSFLTAGYVPHFKCICDDARITMSLCEENVGIGIVPYSASTTSLDSGMISKSITDLSLTSNIELIYDAKSYIPKCSKLFIEYMRDNL